MLSIEFWAISYLIYGHSPFKKRPASRDILADRKRCLPLETVFREADFMQYASIIADTTMKTMKHMKINAFRLYFFMVFMRFMVCPFD